MQKRHKKYKRHKKSMILFTVSSLVLVFVLFIIYSTSELFYSIKVEVGSDNIEVSRFIKNKYNEGTYVTDLSNINMALPGVHKVKIKIRNKVYTSRLKIVDTVAPTAETVNREGWVDEEISAEYFVQNIVDLTEVKVFFKKDPDFSKIGVQEVLIVLEDIGKNKTELKASLTVTRDDEAPKIDGAMDKIFNIGDAISYREDITVIDNRDHNIKLEVDSNAVDLNKVGSYPVIYTARDSTGNTATITVTFKIKEKTNSTSDDIEISRAELDGMADQILATIIKNGMSQEEKARAIYQWSRSQISYIDDYDGEDWIKAAYQGINKNSGDCFVYYATSHELLTRVGIQSKVIINSHDSHYWNLVNIGNGWYHFDTTPRMGDATPYSLFMLTDTQLAAYSSTHNNSHDWDKIKYPATP